MGFVNAVVTQRVFGDSVTGWVGLGMVTISTTNNNKQQQTTTNNNKLRVIAAILAVQYRIGSHKSLLDHLFRRLPLTATNLLQRHHLQLLSLCLARCQQHTLQHML
jgi:hypothetical protein